MLEDDGGRRRRHKPAVWIVAAVVLLVAGWGAIGLWPPATRSVVVLPFENLSRDVEQEYFAAGLSEALLASLGKIEGLKVIFYRGAKPVASTDAVQVAKSLRAEFALLGSVMRDADRVVTTVHLVEARSAQQIWADRYEDKMLDVLESQAVMSKQIAETIRVKLTPRDRTRLDAPRKVVPAAYDEYLLGRYHWNRRTPEDFRKAMAHFGAAIKVDPTWAPPHAGLADAYLLLGSLSYDAVSPGEAMPKAKAEAQSALKLDDSSSEAHTSLAYALMAYDWNMPAAEKEFRRALQLNPGYPTAHHWYGHYLLAMGRMEEGRSEMHTALERDPQSLAINTGVGWSYYLARRYDEAIAQFRKTLDLDGRFVVARCMLGMAYEEKRMYAEAIVELQRALADAPENAFALSRLGQTYAASRNRAEALGILQHLASLSNTRYVPSAYPAAILTALGDNKQAFAWAWKAYGERSHYLIYLNVEPSLDGFRSDAQFPELAKRIGLSR